MIFTLKLFIIRFFFYRKFFLPLNDFKTHVDASTERNPKKNVQNRTGFIETL